MKIILHFLLLFVIKTLVVGISTSKQPHIIIIYADDLGWNDVSFHGSPQIPTPNIDALASSGIILNNYYGECLCTPSRAALLSGKYPIRVGLQHLVIFAGEPTGLPLDVMIMPEFLRDMGYSTHIVGKWHLGCNTKDYTPTYRGFDSFFGYYNGYIDYYDYTHVMHSYTPHEITLFGADLHNGTENVKDFRGRYATHVFTEQAEDIIRNHDPSKPLFLYLAHLATHVGNEYMPLQAPPEIIRKFSYIKEINRRTHAAVVSAMDDSVGKVVGALYDKGILENSIIVFASDNGGESTEINGEYSSNYPLRGDKMTLWEGGVRLPALIWSPLLGLKEPRVSRQLMHVTDWLPTLYTAAGGNADDLGIIDGHNMWEAFLNDIQSPRTELLHTIDPIFEMSALRRGDMKVVNGSSSPFLNGWYGATGFEDMETPKSMDEWVFQHNCRACDILKEAGMWLANQPDIWRKNTEIRCSGEEQSKNVYCNPMEKPCLFNITDDPCEYRNLADKNPEMVQTLMNAIYKYQETAMEPQNTDIDPLANPLYHGFSYVPWRDPEYESKSACGV